MTLAESYLASPDGKDPRHLAHVAEIAGLIFRAGLGLDEEDDIVVEFEGHPKAATNVGRETSPVHPRIKTRMATDASQHHVSALWLKR